MKNNNFDSNTRQHYTATTPFELTDIEKELYTPVYEKYRIYETNFEANLLKLPPQRLSVILKCIDDGAVCSKDLIQFSKTGLYTVFLNDRIILLNSAWTNRSAAKELMEEYIEADISKRYSLELKYENYIDDTQTDNDEEEQNAILHNLMTTFVSFAVKLHCEEVCKRLDEERYGKYNPTAEIVSLNRYNHNIYDFAKYIADNCNSRFGGIRSDIYNCFLAGMIVGKREERKKRYDSSCNNFAKTAFLSGDVIRGIDKIKQTVENYYKTIKDLDCEPNLSNILEDLRIEIMSYLDDKLDAKKALCDWMNSEQQRLCRPNGVKEAV